MGYDRLKREIKYGNENSRIDIFISDDDTQESPKPHCYIKVKVAPYLKTTKATFTMQLLLENRNICVS